MARICMLHFNSSKFLTRVDREAKTLAAHGHHVDLVALKERDTPLFEQRDGYEVRRIRVLTRALPKLNVLKPLKATEGVIRMLWRGWRCKADVYDARDLAPLGVAWLLAKLRRAKVVYSSDELNLDRIFFDRKARWLQRLYGAYERFLIRRADAVIITDRHRGKALEERYPGVRPIVVRNVSEVVKPIPKKASIREFEGRRLKVLIYQGLLSRGRGLEQAIESLEYLEDCGLLVVGYGPLRDELQLLAEDLRVSDRVAIRDAVPFDELVRYTAAAHAGMVLIQDVCRSYYLCAPNKFYEYLMMGVPVVASDFPEMREIVTRYKLGVLVDDPSDAHSVAKAVQKLFADKEAYKQMCRNARAVALKRYNWDVEKKGLLLAYDRVLKVKSR